MTRRRFAPPPKENDIFGAWVPLVALTASKTKPLPFARHDPMITRLERAYTDMATADTPALSSWRDLTDMQNLLQSLVEKEWATDEAGDIDGAKAALLQAAEAFEQHGKLRLTGPSLAQLRNCLDQYTELTRQISEHSYWQAVKHTQHRAASIRRGRIRPGDQVVSL